MSLKNYLKGLCETMKNVIVIIGPTASGKTSLSIKLAKEINGEIISADSMQIYKHMDIGTAKPTMEEREGIPHYLLDEVLPNEEFSVAKFKDLALEHIEEIMKRGKVPIVVGGTGLYINSLLHNINFSQITTDWEYREKLSKEGEEFGNEYLFNKLKEVDPISAKKIHLNDTKRIIRALEVHEATGKPISQHQEMSRLKPSSYHFTFLGLTMDREVLYDRINKRVDKMMEEGLLQEVKGFMEKGFHHYNIPMQAIGYKELVDYLNEKNTFDEAVENIKQGTRRYAKRQMTWFRRLEDVFWLDVKDGINEEIFKKIKDILATRQII